MWFLAIIEQTYVLDCVHVRDFKERVFRHGARAEWSTHSESVKAVERDNAKKEQTLLY